MNNNLIFALDIGTRSVVGIVAEKNGDNLKVIKAKSVFHEQRAMVDGQIEDINKVSKVIKEVKESLETTLNTTFTEAYIAAAGRSLKTEKIYYEKKIDSKVPITKNVKSVFEMEALQKAHDDFYEKEGTDSAFYCVGYSVLTYKVDGNNIGNLVGHRAETIGIELIAAFLPHIVVEGLYACMDNTGLDVASLTLEPIAAMNLVIPNDLRLLNIALVDIGAGTSDIAVSKGGSIVGYDMATVAGDEITECIMKNYLVDFNTAEKIKVALDDENDSVMFNDILGISYTISKADILTSLESSTVELCKEIADKIVELNKDSPVAVFLIGGGSKTANMKKYLSEFLGLPEFRIAIGTQQTVKNVDISEISDFGPELITPVGIAYSSIVNTNYDFFSVMVNGSKVRLYNIRQMKVMDALLMAGFNSKKLIGISGKNLGFTLNNKDYFYKGEYSSPAEIYVNSQVANIETKINPGDVIEVKEAVNGTTPVVKISDLIANEKHGEVTFNNQKVDIGAKYFINNTEVDYNYVIGNSDTIEIINIAKIKNLIELYEFDPMYYNFYVDGVAVDIDTDLQDNMCIDVVEIAKDKKHHLQNEKIVPATQVENEASRKTTDTSSENNDDKVNDTDTNDTINVTVNGTPISLPVIDKHRYIFADMIDYSGIDPSKPKGNIVIKHNGEEAAYTSLIADGDIIQIEWEDSNGN